MVTTQHTVTLYGLSTCIHCRHAIEFLEQSGVNFDRIYVDQLEGEERAEILSIVKSYNPRISFPTIVVDDGKYVIVGFQPNEIREALEL